MDERIFNLPNAPLPLDPDSYYEVLVPDGASATGYTSCKIKPANIGVAKKVYVCNLKNTSGGFAPIINEFENTTGITPSISRISLGLYEMVFTGLFTSSNKLNMPPFANGEDTAGSMIPIGDGGTIFGYYIIVYKDVNTLQLKTFDASFSPTDLYDLCGPNTNLPFNFTVYP
jgi:hypothetical protein